MADADFVNDLVLLANTSAQAELLLCSPEEQQKALVSTWTQIKQRSWVLTEKDLYPLQVQTSEISKQVHIPQQLYLINWKWCQHTPSEHGECYWKVIDHMEIWPLWQNKTWLWEYYWIAASLVLKQNASRKTLIRNTLEWYVLFWTVPHKTVAARPLTSYLTNPPRWTRHAGPYYWNKDEPHKRCFLMDSYPWTRQCWPTSKDFHTSPLCGHWIQSRGHARSGGR